MFYYKPINSGTQWSKPKTIAFLAEYGISWQQQQYKPAGDIIMYADTDIHQGTTALFIINEDNLLAQVTTKN